MPRRPRFTEQELREAIASSRSWSGVLRRLGYRSAGGNWKTLKKYAALWSIETSHFDPLAESLAGLRRVRTRIPLNEVLVSGSNYHRARLKDRLFAEGYKERVCECCGQGEIWRGHRISLILDHINGIPNDNRIENLRIVCPNCAATLDTHCGRKNKAEASLRRCVRCDEVFVPKHARQRYCSQYCGRRWDRAGRKRPGARRVERPPREQLLREVEENGYLAAGRKYGVSDNAIRKWLLEFERERAVAEGRDPRSVEIPRRTWPNRRRAA